MRFPFYLEVPAHAGEFSGHLHLRVGEGAENATGTGKPPADCNRGGPKDSHATWATGQSTGAGRVGGWAGTLGPPPVPAPTSPVSTGQSVHFGPRPARPSFLAPSAAPSSHWSAGTGPHASRGRRALGCTGLCGVAAAMWSGGAWRAALSRVPCGRRAQSAQARLRDILERELEGIRDAGTWKSERVITSRQGPHIHVDGVSGGSAFSFLPGSGRPVLCCSGVRAGCREAGLAAGTLVLESGLGAGQAASAFIAPGPVPLTLAGLTG